MKKSPARGGGLFVFWSIPPVAGLLLAKTKFLHFLFRSPQRKKRPTQKLDATITKISVDSSSSPSRLKDWPTLERGGSTILKLNKENKRTSIQDHRANILLAFIFISFILTSFELNCYYQGFLFVCVGEVYYWPILQSWLCSFVNWNSRMLSGAGNPIPAPTRMKRSLISLFDRHWFAFDLWNRREFGTE